MNVKMINGSSSIYAVFGDPVAHSLSPQMHNTAFAELGMNCVYLPFHVKPQELPGAIKGIRAMNIRGVNLTIPHKQAVLLELDEIFGDSVYSGSVNTIINRDGRLLGTSTDGSGFVQSLKEEGQFDLTGKNVLLMGSGGSAAAIVYSLVNAGIQWLTVVNRDFSRAVDLQEKVWGKTGFSLQVGEFGKLENLEWDRFHLIINSTAVGLHDNDILIPKHYLQSGHFIYDLVYRKGDTKLINDAKNLGCRVLSGLTLLVYQGAHSFYLWFNIHPPIDKMKEAIGLI